MSKQSKRVNIRISQGAHDQLLKLVFKGRKGKATIISVVDALLQL